jgi:hypothetical protein
MDCRHRKDENGLPERKRVRPGARFGSAPPKRVGTPWTSLLPATMYGAGSRAKNDTGKDENGLPEKMDCRNESACWSHPPLVKTPPQKAYV